MFLLWVAGERGETGALSRRPDPYADERAVQLGDGAAVGMDLDPDRIDERTVCLL